MILPALFISFVEEVPWSQPMLWFCSALLGILACRTIYKAMRVVSPLFPEYIKLSKTEKIEWDNRGFSTAHAIMISAAAIYFLFFSELFKDEAPYGPVSFRNSTSSQMVLGISFGYFISDLAMILWFYPTLGGNEYVIHHLLSMVSLSVALYSGHGNYYIYMVLLSEVTTPFVNLRWYLSVAGMKDTSSYVINGICLFFGWMMARVVLFIYFFIHLYVHYDQVKLMSSAAFYCIMTIPPCLAVLNLGWFYKVSKGMLKTLSKKA